MRSCPDIFTTRPLESASLSCMAGVAVTRTDLKHWMSARKVAVSAIYSDACVRVCCYTCVYYVILDSFHADACNCTHALY